jgi:5-formyltetrahydrofolate cyclo-ligase
MRNSDKEIILEKKKLRNYIQDKRAALSIKEREIKSKSAAEKFFSIKDYIKARNILICYPFRGEINTKIIIEDALNKGKKIILPRVDKNKLNLYFVSNLKDQLEKGAYGIMEPAPLLCKRARAADIDLAVIPGIGFDKNFNRLGYGGGFFDRLLPYLPKRVKKVALCFDIQVMPDIPVTRNDKKIDILITESKIYNSC